MQETSTKGIAIKIAKFKVLNPFSPRINLQRVEYSYILFLLAM